ncbi:phospholipase-like protein [Tanacetum coccineum]
MMSEMDIESLTIEQYLMLTEGNQAPGIEYEAEMERQIWRNTGSYFPTKYDNKNVNSFNYKESWNLGYKYHFDDSKINAHYDLSSLLPCFEPIQPHAQDRYESLEEDIDFVSEDESEIGEQGVEMEKRMCRQDKESEEDAGVSFVADDEEGDTSGALPCKLPPKELNLGSFTLPYIIGNFYLYVMAYLGASVNAMPKSIFEHLKLASLKETSTIVKMANMTKKTPLGIIENILVKIGKFLFPSDFIIIDMLGEPNETMILGRPFLATIHVQIDVFKREISLGIGEDRVKFDMDGGISHSRNPVEKIYMASFIHEEEYFNPLEIKDDVFSYESPACLIFKQHTHSYDNESIDTLDSAGSIQGLKENREDVVRTLNLERIVSR